MTKLISTMLLCITLMTAVGCDPNEWPMLRDYLEEVTGRDLTSSHCSDWNGVCEDPTCIIPGYCGEKPWYPTTTESK